jgi:hypothetical protein
MHERLYIFSHVFIFFIKDTPSQFRVLLGWCRSKMRRQKLVETEGIERAMKSHSLLVLGHKKNAGKFLRALA